MTLIEALIIAAVEGLTEYLPVSSTGHIIIASSLMGINEEPFTKDFTVIVQFGAILSVLVLYWQRFMTSWKFYLKLLAGFIPAAIIGLLVKDKIDLVLGDVRVVAIALIAGGVILLFVDRWFSHQEERLRETNSGTVDQLTYSQAFGIGFIQCLAFIPGVSRSASSIIGGLSLKLTRRAAAEFSFFLGVPTLTAATGLKVLKTFETIESNQIIYILAGNIVSFIVGVISIKYFIEFLARHGFFYFGIYRIILGATILILLATGHSLAVT